MNSATLDSDTGLAAMLAAAESGDHGVVADWIEEYLSLDDLAAILRVGQDDPRRPWEHERTVCREFRYRRLDQFVLLAMAGYHVWEPFVAGQPRKPDPGGLVVCLCTPPDAPGGLRRWARWFPAMTEEPTLRGLWDELGADMPQWG